ncbi:hypothetical protein FE257_008386, partial [Aspergillus nanangensis]
AIRRCQRGYMDNLHKLHPFLDQNDLDRKIDLFIKAYCQGQGANNGDMPRGAKRKRSCEALQGAGCDMGAPDTFRSEPGSIEKSIDSAVILLVLALGSICNVRLKPVPGPVMDHIVDFRKEQIPGASTRNAKSPSDSDSVVPSGGSFYSAKNNSFASPTMGE